MTTTARFAFAHSPLSRLGSWCNASRRCVCPWRAKKGNAAEAMRDGGDVLELVFEMPDAARPAAVPGVDDAEGPAALDPAR